MEYTNLDIKELSMDEYVPSDRESGILGQYTSMIGQGSIVFKRVDIISMSLKEIQDEILKIIEDDDITLYNDAEVFLCMISSIALDGVIVYFHVTSYKEDDD